MVLGILILNSWELPLIKAVIPTGRAKKEFNGSPLEKLLVYVKI